MDFHRLDADLKKILATPLEHIDLSVRAANVLRVHDFKYLGDLVPLTDSQYLRMPNFGQKSLKEIKALLSNNDLENGIQLNGWNRQAAESIREEIKAQERRSKAIASSGGVEDKLIQLSKANRQLRVSLVRRITELGLSNRLTNRLIEKNCVYVGDVITFTDAELLRTWNFGRKSLRELHKKLNVFGLKTGHTLKGWNRKTADALRTELESEIRETWAAGSKYPANLKIKTLEQELEAVLKFVVSGRNVDLVSKLWGWSGNGQRTLESVGGEYGLTRERVRQIAAKAEKHIRNLPVAAPHLQAAVQYINEQSPVLAIDVEEGLRSSGFTSSPFEISGLLNASEKLLIGAEVPPGSVEAHQPTFKPGKRILDFGWRDGRYIWVLYDLTESLARDGLASVPASIKEFLHGEWPAQRGNAGRVEKISIKDNRIYGFLKLIERRGAEAGDKVVLVFDTKERLLRIDLGGDDLLDRYQDNDFSLADKYLSQVDLDGKD